MVVVGFVRIVGLVVVCIFVVGVGVIFMVCSDTNADLEFARFPLSMYISCVGAFLLVIRRLGICLDFSFCFISGFEFFKGICRIYEIYS